MRAVYYTDIKRRKTLKNAGNETTLVGVNQNSHRLKKKHVQYITAKRILLCCHIRNVPTIYYEVRE